MEPGEEWATVLMRVDAEELDFPIMEEFQPVSIVAQLPPSGLARYKYDPTHMDLTIRDSHRQQLLEMYERGDLADTTKPIVHKVGKARYSSTTVQRTAGGAVDAEGGIDWQGITGSGKQNIDEMSIDPDESGSQETEEIPLDSKRLEALEKQRKQNRQPLPVVVEGPASTNDSEEESLSGLEKEALANMAQTQKREGKKDSKVVAFKVENVRD